MGKTNTLVNKWLLACIAVFAAFYFFIFLTNNASAAGAGLDTADYIYFRIDTELDVLNDNGVTVTWSCGGGATSGSHDTYFGSVVEDGVVASDSDSLLNGIVKVASQSEENIGTNGSGCDVGETVTATVSLDGWITRTVTSSILDIANFAVGASQDYAVVVSGVADELGTALTLDGTTASATYNGTFASQSYSNYDGTWRKYIAATSDNTVTGGADGYVNRISSALTTTTTASQSVDFGTTDDSDLDESGLSFGHKVQVHEYQGTFALNKITTGTVTAGDSFGTTCTAGTGTNLGQWYCAVPLANTETSIKYSGASTLKVTTVTTADRTTGSDGQHLSTIAPQSNISGGGSYTEPSSSPTSTPTPTSTPVPTPTSTPTPTSIPPPIALDTPAAHNFVSLAALNIREGEVVSAAGSDDPDIYIPNEHGYKRLFLNPVIFGFYGHLGGFANVKSVVPTVRDTMVTSGLFRNCETDDEKVYGVETTGEDTGVLHWVNTTGDQAVADDPDFFKKVFCINSNEFNWYQKGSDYTSVNQIPTYSR
jgi:hypothetical protein